MWNDPEYSLASARERQGEIARQVAAERAGARAATAFAEVVHTWTLAVRTTADFLRGPALRAKE